MTHYSETILDEKGIELTVTYNIYRGNVNEILSVKLAIDGRGIEILPSLSTSQLDSLACELTPFELEEIND